MRIVYIYPVIATKGGVERILVEKMNHLALEKDYEVFLLTYDQGTHDLSFQLDERVRHIDLQVRTFVQYRYVGLRRLWERWRRRRWLHQRLLHQLDLLSPDVIITTTNGEVALLNSLRAGIPLVIESHGGFNHVIDYEKNTWMHRLDIRRRYKEISKADAIICLTNADAERWIGHGFMNVHTISNIANLNPTDMLSDCYGKRALFVGRFSIQKGIQELLAIWEIVHRHYPDWTMEMYGENYEQYKDIVGEGVCLHAPTSSIFSKYCESSMLLLTSRWEPFGLVIPEAMSCGVPVVSFEGDGPCEIITDGVDGYIVKDRNIEEFADKVCKLIENVELRQQMGKNAIQKAQRYSADNIMPMWKELFDSFKK